MPEAGIPPATDSFAVAYPVETAEGLKRQMDEAAQAMARVATIPTIGRIVHYKLSQDDVKAIANSWPLGNSRTGQVVPAVVVNVFEASTGYVNLHVFLDGPGTFWATSRLPGDEPGQWTWPLR